MKKNRTQRQQRAHDRVIRSRMVLICRFAPADEMALAMFISCHRDTTMTNSRAIRQAVAAYMHDPVPFGRLDFKANYGKLGLNRYASKLPRSLVVSMDEFARAHQMPRRRSYSAIARHAVHLAYAPGESQ